MMLVAGSAFIAAGTARAAEPVLVQVLMQGLESDSMGELVRENATTISLLDLKSSKERTLLKSDIKKIVRDLSDDEAVAASDLPSVLAWKIKKLSGVTPQRGAVAKVVDGVVYISAGSKAGISEGDTLNVFRESGEIVDPLTKKVIASERPRVAQVRVSEVQDAYSKAKLLGVLETKLNVGDIVESIPLKISVAVVPMVDGEGKGIPAGQSLAEDLTTKLVSRNVDVVEREVLGKAFKELALQQSEFFDAAKAQRLGKLLGASTVLTGRIVPDGTKSKAHVRLISVETGKVLLAASQTVAGQTAGAGSTVASAGSGGTATKTATGGAPVPGEPDPALVLGEHERLAEVHWTTSGPPVYKTKVNPKDPVVQVSTTSICFQASSPADDTTAGKVEVSVDYGKTWVTAYKWQTADFKAAKRRDNWFAFSLAPAMAKNPKAETDEVQVRFSVDRMMGHIRIQKVVWVKK